MKKQYAIKKKVAKAIGAMFKIKNKLIVIFY